MAGRPGTLPWNMATFTGANPVTTLSDNFNFLNNQINDSGAGFTTFSLDTGTPNNLIATLAAAPVAYEAGMMMCIVPANTNTGISVINVNSLGNQTINNPAGQSLTAGALSKNALVTLVYDGTNFRVVGPCPFTANFPSNSVNQTMNVAGATSVVINVNQTGGSCAILMNNLGAGVPVSVTLVNSTGGGAAFSIAATSPSGGSITTQGPTTNVFGANTVLSTPFSIASGVVKTWTSAGYTGTTVSFT